MKLYLPEMVQTFECLNKSQILGQIDFQLEKLSLNKSTSLNEPFSYSLNEVHSKVSDMYTLVDSL